MTLEHYARIEMHPTDRLYRFTCTCGESGTWRTQHVLAAQDTADHVGFGRLNHTVDGV